MFTYIEIEGDAERELENRMLDLDDETDDVVKQVKRRQETSKNGNRVIISPIFK